MRHTRRFDRLKQGVKRAERLFELGAIDNGAPPTLSLEQAGLVEMPYSLTDRVATDLVVVGEPEIRREALVEAVILASIFGNFRGMPTANAEG